MPDGILLHLRDTYPIETAWAPKWVGDELRQVRAAAWDARLAGLRTSAEAAVAQQRGDHQEAARKEELPGSYQALHDAYRQRAEPSSRAATAGSCRYSDSALRPRPPRPGPDPPGPHASFARGIKPARARALSSRFLGDPSRMRWSGA